MSKITLPTRNAVYAVKSAFGADVGVMLRHAVVVAVGTEAPDYGRFATHAEAESVARAMNEAHWAGFQIGMTAGQDLLARLIGSTCETFRDKSKDPVQDPRPAAPPEIITISKRRRK